MRILAWTLVAIATSVAALDEARACSCIPDPGVEQRFKMAESVFDGTVMGIAMVGRELDVTFTVHRIWKGPIAPVLTVRTASDGAACGVSFGVGERWLVFASDWNMDKTLETGLCSYDKPIGAAMSDIAALGKPIWPDENADMSVVRDMAMPEDLAKAPDDLAAPADLSTARDMAMGGGGDGGKPGGGAGCDLGRGNDWNGTGALGLIALVLVRGVSAAFRRRRSASRRPG